MPWYDDHSYKAGGNVQAAHLLISFLWLQADVVVLTCSIVEYSAWVQSEPACSASIVRSHVLIHDKELNLSSSSWLNGNWEGFIPCDGFLFDSSIKDFGFELSLGSKTVVDFGLDIVFHFSEGISAFLEDSVANGDINLWHINYIE